MGPREFESWRREGEGVGGWNQEGANRGGVGGVGGWGHGNGAVSRDRVELVAKGVVHICIGWCMGGCGPHAWEGVSP